MPKLLGVYKGGHEENCTAKRQKYEDNSAAIKASERNRYWNDTLSDWLKVAAERTRYQRNYQQTVPIASEWICHPHMDGYHYREQHLMQYQVLYICGYSGINNL